MPYPARVRNPEPRRSTTLFLAAAGGVATMLAFPDTGWWPTAFVGVALLYLALRRDGAWWNALVGLVYGLAFFLPHIWWSYVATAAVPWLALSITESVFVAGFAAAWTWVRRVPAVREHAWLQVLVLPLLWVAVEQWRSIWPFGGFPWGKLAFSQEDSPLLHAAWLGGAPLVSFLVAAVGVLLGVALLALGAQAVPRRAGAGVVVVAVAGVLLVVPLAIPLATDAQDGTLRTGAVQGNVDEPGLGSFANRGEVLQNHVDGTKALLEQVDPGDLDVVLWPENGSDLDPQTNPDVAADIDDAARTVGAPILVGAQEFPESGGRYNVLLLWEPGVGVTDRYAKQHPAAFGEYIPIRGFVRLFSDQVDRITTDMIPGRGAGVMDLDVPRLGRTVPLATLICFEVAYDGLIQDAVRDGGEVLVIPTNNASFGFTAESTQQLAMSRLRAVETGRATVQISTVGVSGVIAPDGTVLQSTDLFTAAQMVSELPLRTSLTPAVVAGRWVERGVWALSVLLLAGGVVAGVRGRRRARTAAPDAQPAPELLPH
ncbi:apolipoprotein N-acyltransferase [Cellulomonas sp. PhB143]|nr:apolipoprotein N-acyltransferase [Cellulomonas sp. PhB143]